MFGEQMGELKKGKTTFKGNFTEENNSNRDRFGNQLLTSEEFTYLDNSGKETKAGILISPEGQKFIAENPRILQDIEKGLTSFVTESGNLERVIDLGNGRSLQYVTRGSQSNFYILKINDNKYAIKSHLTEVAINEKKMDQPYINEMLQTQAVASDLKDKLSSLKVKMASFLFASGQVSCTQYEQEEKNYSGLTVPHLTELFEAASRYVSAEKVKDDPLWSRIKVDLNGNLETISRNFKTKKDGTLVWVDPFVYSEPEHYWVG